MGEGQGPETQIRGRVGDGAQDELDGVDHLRDANFPKVEFAAAMPVAAARLFLLFGLVAL